MYAHESFVRNRPELLHTLRKVVSLNGTSISANTAPDALDDQQSEKIKVFSTATSHKQITKSSFFETTSASNDQCDSISTAVSKGNARNAKQGSRAVSPSSVSVVTPIMAIETQGSSFAPFNAHGTNPIPQWIHQSFAPHPMRGNQQNDMPTIVADVPSPNSNRGEWDKLNLLTFALEHASSQMN
jgi:hypothetical protein